MTRARLVYHVQRPAVFSPPPLRKSGHQAKMAGPDGLPVLVLDQALDRLAGMDEDLARIVELRAFGGMTIEEAACVLDVSLSTAKRE